MTTYYADSSALVKRYVNEPGSAWVQALCASTVGHVIALAHIGLVEIAAALAMKVRCSYRTPGFFPAPPADGAGMVKELSPHLRPHVYLCTAETPRKRCALRALSGEPFPPPLLADPARAPRRGRPTPRQT